MCVCLGVPVNRILFICSSSAAAVKNKGKTHSPSFFFGGVATKIIGTAFIYMIDFTC